MCGIIGVINASKTLRPEFNGFIRDGIIAGAVRGVDSVGIGQICTKLKRSVHKDIINPLSFLETKAAKAMTNDADDAYFTAVHHRAATVGKVSVEAAQPFGSWDSYQNKYQPLTYHNGTLRGYRLYDPDTKTTFASDSDWLAYHIASNVDKEDGELDLDKAFGKLDGAFSIVTVINGRVYMANNGERPMTVAFTEDEAAVLFASEAGMLHWLAERNKIKLKNNKIFQLAKDKVYIFDFLDTDNKVVAEVKSYVKSVTPAVSSAGSNYTYGGGGGYYSRKAKQISEFNDLYKEVTGKEPIAVIEEEPTVSPITKESLPVTTPVGVNDNKVTSLVPRNRQSDTDLEAELVLKGVVMDFCVNQYDSTSGVAFGWGWPTDASSERVVASARKVLDAGNIMFSVTPEMESMILGSDGNEIFTGKIVAIRYVTENKNGTSVRVPYMVINSNTVKVVPATVTPAS